MEQEQTLLSNVLDAQEATFPEANSRVVHDPTTDNPGAGEILVARIGDPAVVAVEGATQKNTLR